MPVKLFHGELADIESEVNKWEKSKGCEIVHIALAIGKRDQEEMFPEGAEDYYDALVTWRERTSVVQAAEKPMQNAMGHGEYPGEIPKCTLCSSQMTLRRKRIDGTPFFGCSKFPSCRNIVNLTPEQMALLGSNPGYNAPPRAPFDGTRHDPVSPNEHDYTNGSPFNPDDDDIPF